MKSKIIKKVLSGILSVSLMFQMGITVVYADSLKTPSVDGNWIFANGTPLLITGDDRSTTIYIDTNANGVLDNGEKSLAESGITGAPSNNGKLSTHCIYGGSNETDVQYNTHIVMTGGYISALYGGCFTNNDAGSLTGDTYIKVTGGTIKEKIKGGSSGPEGKTLTGNTTVIVTGGTARYDVNGGCDSGTVTGNKNGIVTSTKAYEPSFTNGFLKTGDNTYIAKGTITLPSDFDFTLPTGSTLTVQEDATIINQGKITLKGDMVNNGTFTNDGTVKNEGGSYSGSGTWNGTPMEDLKLTVSTAKEITDSSAKVTVNCNKDATVYYLASKTPISDTSILETQGKSQAISANTDTNIALDNLTGNTSYTYYVVAKAGGTFTDIKTLAFTTLKKSPNLQLKGTMSGKVFDDTPISHSTAKGDLFTWDSKGTISFTYFIYNNGTKTTAANSGATSEGAEPKNVGTYYLKATLSENGEYAGAESEYIQFTIKSPLSGTGTETNPYIIKTAADLSYLANSVRAGQNYSDKYFKLNNDITYSSMPIGSFTEGSNTNTPFCGNFHGAGHTVTLAMTNANSGVNQAVALFGYLGSGAVVQYINTTGTITSSGQFSAGIAGVARDGAVNISNCSSNVEMNFTPGGDCTYGGIVGLINNSGNVTMTNCYFTGKIITTPSKTLEGVGGLCGWKESTSTLNAVNCYVDASFGSSSITAKGKYMARNGGDFTNCYYNKEKTLTDDNPANFTGIEAVTNDFTSGKIAWLIQNGQSNKDIQAWGQTLTGDIKDNNPVLSSDSAKAVHKVSYYQDGQELVDYSGYVNSSMTLPILTLTEEEKNQGYRYSFEITSGNAKLDTANNQLKDIGGDITVTVTKKIVMDEQSAMVIFKSYYGQEMSKSQLGSSDTIILPEGPTRYGYTFTRWSMTAEEIQKQIAAGTKVITVEPIYALNDKSYNITVTDGTGRGIYKQNDVVTATANHPKKGMKFSYWTDENSNILSYNTTYQFYATKDIEITANYVEDTTVVEAKGTAEIINIDKDTERSKLIFVSMVTVPKGCKIQEAGIIGTDKETVGTNGDGFNKDTADYVRGNAWSGNAYRFTWTKKVTADQTWYTRAYVVYEDTNGKIITIYGKIITAKLNN